MTTTGWSSEAPEEQAPAMPLTAMALRRTERGPGDTLAIALARSRAAEAREIREEAAARPDPDSIAAGYIQRGYKPGMASDLGMQLADVTAELQAEQEKLERGRRRQERITRDHAAGRITVFDIMRMQDVDDGDADKVGRLERRAESLRRQIADAQAAIAPQRQEPADPFEAATRRAHQAFREITRAKMAAAEAGRPAPRPFASGGGSAVRSEEPVTCEACLEVGATPWQSWEIHHTDADGHLLAVEAEEAAERRRHAGAGREITR